MRAAWALIGAVALGGCEDRVVERARAIEARACACAAPTCVEAAIDAFAELNVGSVPARHRGALEASARAIVRCLDRLLDRQDAAAEAAVAPPAPAAGPGPSEGSGSAAP